MPTPSDILNDAYGGEGGVQTAAPAQGDMEPSAYDQPPAQPKTPTDILSDVYGGEGDVQSDALPRGFTNISQEGTNILGGQAMKAQSASDFLGAKMKVRAQVQDEQGPQDQGIGGDTTPMKDKAFEETAQALGRKNVPFEQILPYLKSQYQGLNFTPEDKAQYEAHATQKRQEAETQTENWNPKLSYDPDAEARKQKVNAFIGAIPTAAGREVAGGLLGASGGLARLAVSPFSAGLSKELGTLNEDIGAAVDTSNEDTKARWLTKGLGRVTNALATAVTTGGAATPAMALEATQSAGDAADKAGLSGHDKLLFQAGSGLLAALVAKVAGANTGKTGADILTKAGAKQALGELEHEAALLGINKFGDKVLGKVAGTDSTPISMEGLLKDAGDVVTDAILFKSASTLPHMGEQGRIDRAQEELVKQNKGKRLVEGMMRDNLVQAGVDPNASPDTKITPSNVAAEPQEPTGLPPEEADKIINSIQHPDQPVLDQFGLGAVNAEGKVDSGAETHVPGSKDATPVNERDFTKQTSPNLDDVFADFEEHAKAQGLTDSGVAREAKKLHVDVEMNDGTVHENVSPAEAETLVKSEKASVPTMVTRDMRQRLYDKGYSRSEVDGMKPQEAWEAINGTDNRSAARGAGIPEDVRSAAGAGDVEAERGSAEPAAEAASGERAAATGDTQSGAGDQGVDAQARVEPTPDEIFKQRLAEKVAQIQAMEKHVGKRPTAAEVKSVVKGVPTLENARQLIRHALGEPLKLKSFMQRKAPSESQIAPMGEFTPEEGAQHLREQALVNEFERNQSVKKPEIPQIAPKVEPPETLDEEIKPQRAAKELKQAFMKRKMVEDRRVEAINDAESRKRAFRLKEKENAPQAQETPSKAVPETKQASAAAFPLPMEDVQHAVDKLTSVKKDIERVLAPAALSEEASKAAGSMRENVAEMHQRNERAATAMKEFGAVVGKMRADDQIAFTDAVETGNSKNLPPTLEAGAKVIREQYDLARENVKKVRPELFDSFIQDYMAHNWKQGPELDRVMSEMSKKPLAGSKGFMKKRTIPTQAEGIALGLEPVETNPVKQAQAKIQEMNKFSMAEKALQDIGAQHIGSDQKPPPGWKKIEVGGNVYAPEDAALIVNRYLSSGMKGNAAMDAFIGAGNVMNQFQLGLSPFHIFTTSLNAMVSKAALGVQEVGRGRPLKALKAFALTPTAPIEGMVKGSNVLSEYLRKGGAPEMAAVVDSLVAGGGRGKQPSQYSNQSVDNFLTHLKEGRFLHAAANAVPAVLEKVSSPILNEFVPRLKMGIFADMAAHELQNLGANPTREQVRETMGKAWDSVDNRLGQLTYDNLFWHKTLKDALMATTRSVGWNLGTVRELGGGVKDLLQKPFSGGQKGISSRSAFTITLPFTMAVLGGITHYLYTGKKPDEMKDLFFPKNGETGPDGNPERVKLPGYMNDMISYGKHPLDTASHKLSPLLSTMAEMFNNKDFYGNQIYSQDHPLKDLMAYAEKSLTPFSVRNVQESQKREQPVSKQVQSFLGVTPAPQEEVRTAAQNKLLSLVKHVNNGRTPDEADTADARKQIENNIRQGMDPHDALTKAMESGKVTEKQALGAAKKAKGGAYDFAFQHVSLDDKGKVLAEATPAEKAAWMPLYEKSVTNAIHGAASQFQPKAVKDHGPIADQRAAHAANVADAIERLKTVVKSGYIKEEDLKALAKKVPNGLRSLFPNGVSKLE